MIATVTSEMAICGCQKSETRISVSENMRNTVRHQNSTGISMVLYQGELEETVPRRLLLRSVPEIIIRAYSCQAPTSKSRFV